MRKVIARSASDSTDDWPYWMLWDGAKNVTAEVLDEMGIPRIPGQVLLTRAAAEQYAKRFRDEARP
jgi:hypothetical protein